MKSSRGSLSTASSSALVALILTDMRSNLNLSTYFMSPRKVWEPVINIKAITYSLELKFNWTARWDYSLSTVWVIAITEIHETWCLIKNSHQPWYKWPDSYIERNTAYELLHLIFLPLTINNKAPILVFVSITLFHVFYIFRINNIVKTYSNVQVSVQETVTQLHNETVVYQQCVNQRFPHYHTGYLTISTTKVHYVSSR